MLTRTYYSLNLGTLEITNNHTGEVVASDFPNVIEAHRCLGVLEALMARAATDAVRVTETVTYRQYGRRP
jgi:hypothetical protein